VGGGFAIVKKDERSRLALQMRSVDIIGKVGRQVGKIKGERKDTKGPSHIHPFQKEMKKETSFHRQKMQLIHGDSCNETRRGHFKELQRSERKEGKKEKKKNTKDTNKELPSINQSG
jgi:hypothetical protein